MIMKRKQIIAETERHKFLHSEAIYNLNSGEGIKVNKKDWNKKSPPHNYYYPYRELMEVKQKSEFIYLIKK